MKKSLILITLFFLSIKIQAQVVFVSDFHKGHAGQIVFNKETSPDEKTANNFITDFNNKDDITAYVYMKDVVQNYEIYNKATSQKGNAIERKYFIKYFIDDVDQEIKGTRSALNSSREGVTAFTIKVLRQKSSTDHDGFVNKVMKLKGGKYKVRIEMWGGNETDNATKEPIAKGEFTLEKIEYVAPSIGPYKSLIPEMVNADLEKQAQKLVNAETASTSFKYSKPKIASKDWTIVKDEINSKPSYRSITIIFYQIGDPKSICRAMYFRFKQDYVGGGKYSNTLSYVGMTVSDRVDCE